MDAQKAEYQQPMWTGLELLAARGRPLLLASLVLSLALVMVRSSLAEEPLQRDQVIDGFLQACSGNDSLSEQKQEKVLEIVSNLLKDDRAAEAAITQALREIHPEFDAALNALSDKDIGGGVSRLRPLVAAEDPYLAAESSFFLARAYLEDDDYEQALPLLIGVIEKHADHCLRVGEATFLRGISELQVLKRVEAMNSFAEFLERYPNAPARMLGAARENLLLLEQLELGSINDVHGQMEFSHRKLSLEDSGAKTQEVQDEIVVMLTSLIEEIEKKGGT